MNDNEMMQGDEISLYDLVQPLLENWKLIVVTALLGVLAGAAGWWLKGYDAELKAKPLANLDFVEWRRIVSGLPMLAESRLMAGQSSATDEALFGVLRSGEWWTKNVTPQYRYSKSDLKELGAIAKEEQEKGATVIEAVVFRGKAGDRDDAIAKAGGAERFVREGGLLLALKRVIEERDYLARQVSAEVAAKLSRNEIELGYLEKRSLLLKKMAEQFPEKGNAYLQSVLDPKGELARFLPVATQQIAVSTEINSLQETISRSRDLLVGAEISRAFIERAMPLLKSEPNGFVLATKLEAILDEMRKGIDPANKPQVAVFNEIVREVSATRQRFQSLFESETLIATKRPARGLPMALGLVGGGLAGILFVFLRAGWRRAKRDHDARAVA